MTKLERRIDCKMDVIVVDLDDIMEEQGDDGFVQVSLKVKMIRLVLRE